MLELSPPGLECHIHCGYDWIVTHNWQSTSEMTDGDGNYNSFTLSGHRRVTTKGVKHTFLRSKAALAGYNYRVKPPNRKKIELKLDQKPTAVIMGNDGHLTKELLRSSIHIGATNQLTLW